MRKILVGTALALGLLAPGSAAYAGPIAGVSQCPSGSIGVIVWHGDYNTGGPVELVRVCIPVG